MYPWGAEWVSAFLELWELWWKLEPLGYTVLASNLASFCFAGIAGLAALIWDMGPAKGVVVALMKLARALLGSW